MQILLSTELHRKEIAMEYMHELKDMLCEELEKIVEKGELTAGSLETIDKLTHSIKSVSTIMAMEDSGYSNDDMNGYRASYAQRRDSRGRYSRNSRMNRNSYAGYSRRGGYSRDDETEKMVEKLERMMEKTTDQNAKTAIQEAISAIEM